MPPKPKKSASPKKAALIRSASNDLQKSSKKAKRARTGGRSSAVAEALEEVADMERACEAGEDDHATEGSTTPPDAPSPVQSPVMEQESPPGPPKAPPPPTKASPVEQPPSKASSRIQDQNRNKLEEETQKRAAAEERVKELERQLSRKSGKNAPPSDTDAPATKTAKKMATKVCHIFLVTIPAKGAESDASC